VLYCVETAERRQLITKMSSRSDDSHILLPFQTTQCYVAKRDRQRRR